MDGPHMDPQHETFLRDHSLAVMATGRADGSPQQSMVMYAVDDDDRILISAKAWTAKWRNARRQPRVSLTVTDGRVHLVVYGTAEGIDADPERAELTADVIGALGDRPDPSTLTEFLERDQRVVLRITPEKVLFHE